MTEKFKDTLARWKAGLIGAALVAVVLVGSLAYSYSGGSPKVVVEGDYIEAAEQDKAIGAGIETGERAFADGLSVSGCFKQKGDGEKYLCRELDVEDWPSTTTTLALRNPTFGKENPVTTTVQVRFDMSGTTAQNASSTFRVYCGKQPNQFVAPNATTPPSGIISGFQVATGTQRVFDTMASSTVTLVGPNDFLVCFAQHGESPGSICAADHAQCEAVTSTARGWVADLIASWEYVK